MSIIKLPKIIDPSAMKQGLSSAESEISVASFDRLCSIAANTEKSVWAQLSWGIDSNSSAMISGKLHGLLALQCQRCLGEFPFQVDREFSLEVVYRKASDEALQTIDNLSQVGREKLILDVGDVVGVVDLIEDEILLGLPMYIKHPSKKDCDQSMLRRATEYEADSDSATENPFAVLKNLKSLE